MTVGVHYIILLVLFVVMIIATIGDKAEKPSLLGKRGPALGWLVTIDVHYRSSHCQTLQTAQERNCRICLELRDADI